MTDEHSNERLFVQLLALVWLCTGHAGYFLLPGFDLTGLALALVSISGSVAILASNRLASHRFGASWLRLGCGMVAFAIATASLLSPSYLAFNRLFCAACFLCVALVKQKWSACLHVQASLLYLAAAVDKICNPLWRGGQSISRFASELADFGTLWAPGGKVGKTNEWARFADSLLSSSTHVAATVAWFVVAFELALALAFFRRHKVAAPLSLVFHSALALFTGGTFGMFFYAGILASVLVAPREWLSQNRIKVWLVGLALYSCLPWFAIATPLSILALGTFLLLDARKFLKRADSPAN